MHKMTVQKLWMLSGVRAAQQLRINCLAQVRGGSTFNRRTEPQFLQRSLKPKIERGFIEESGGLKFYVAGPGDYDDIMAISNNVYWGYDYLPHRYDQWMNEPNRVVVIAKKDEELVAMESAVVVDDGHTLVAQGLRVKSDERGHNLTSRIHNFTENFIRHLYPTLGCCRIFRTQDRGPGRMSVVKLDQRAILSLCCEDGSFATFVNALKRKLYKEDQKKASSAQIVEVEDQGDQLENILLDPQLPSNVHLPSGVIVQDWLPLKPIQSNLSILRRKALTWMADRLHSPSFLSLHTSPYPVPFSGGAQSLSVDLFGTNAALARMSLLTHLKKVQNEVAGRVVVHVFMHSSLLADISAFCDSTAVRKCEVQMDQVLLEKKF